MYRQGDVVLVSFPFTDLTSTKRRPAVVVSPDTFNARNEDVVLVAVTSQIVRDAATVLLGQRDVVEGVLPKAPVARLAKIFTLHSSLVVKRLCRLKGEKRDEVLRELRSFFR
ncbi:MAG: type II toxin-antitoxin system PemK/MazF family toxin [Bryobacteraceae bacterium]|jgi:mRNA interferase MazF